MTLFSDSVRESIMAWYKRSQKTIKRKHELDHPNRDKRKHGLGNSNRDKRKHELDNLDRDIEMPDINGPSQMPS